MKVLVLTILVVVVRGDDDDGLYRPDELGQYSSGDYDDGRYIPDNSGLYIPDNSGLYQPDDSGKYKDDGTGRYSGQNQRYRNSFERFRGNIDRFRANSDIFRGGNIDRSNFVRVPPLKPLRIQIHPSPSPSFGQNIIGSGDEEKGQDNFRPEVPRGFSAFGDSPAATSNTPKRNFPPAKFPIGGKYNKGRYDDSRWRIIKQNGDVSGDGYHWDYETENGITAEETGKVANKGSGQEAMRSKGFYKYTGPDNVVYTVTYTADENGFVPQGNHLPTPPPIPAAILKSLELNKSNRKL